ncbi:MAG TPA: hypothetical protein GX497_03445 [Bacillus bacterium]|nr:hypothetical protein [Bacillus sp. (in: firmicutes)]
MNKNIDQRLFPSSEVELNFKFKKEQMVGYLLFEIKGIVDSMEDFARYEDVFEHPTLDRLKNKVNAAVECFISAGEIDSNEINFEK